MELQDIHQKMVRREVEIPIRVRSYETDQMGVIRHANYFEYFTVARMEHFRTWGHPYGEMEQVGIFLMIINKQCKCRSPACFDEVTFIRA